MTTVLEPPTTPKSAVEHHNEPPRIRYERERGWIHRHVPLARGGRSVTRYALAPTSEAKGPVENAHAEAAWLRDETRPEWPEADAFNVLDLFSGCGGLSLGVADALKAVGRPVSCLGVDIDETALDVYDRNLPGSVLRADLGEMFASNHGRRPTAVERRFAAQFASEVEFLLAGPPCQGHSAFNNRTRHDDTRNGLFLSVVRAAELLEPRHVMIENVPGALRDRSEVVQRTLDGLGRLGYFVDAQVVDMSQLGIPQTRKRLLVYASRTAGLTIDAILAPHAVEPRTTEWAIRDLEDVARGDLFNTPARSAPQTRARIDVLFDRELWNLPNANRPACHAHGNHSYRSIYGRLRWEQPAQTITTGFYSMCMGRYVHPSRRRTITAHEAARLQFIPDSFDFAGVPKRSDLARLIGNAVPPKLGAVAGLELAR